jgi:hypothetical protein
MAKRFADTEIWQKEWFLKLSLKHKMLIKFLFDNCDCAGIYEPNFTLLSFYLGEPVNASDFEELKQVRRLENGNYFIEDFINFQYNTDISSLNPKFSVHKGIIKQLEKNNITLTQPLSNPSVKVNQPLQDMDMVMDKDMDINKDINKDKESTNIVQLSSTKLDTLDFVSSKQCREMFEIYQEECKELAPLSFERRNKRIVDKMAVYLNETDNDIGVFRDVCKKANKLKTIANRLIDFETVINCYVGILNGKYIDKEQEQNSIEALRARLLGKGNE